MPRKALDAVKTVSAQRLGFEKAHLPRYRQDGEEVVTDPTLGGLSLAQAMRRSNEKPKRLSQPKARETSRPRCESRVTARLKPTPRPRLRSSSTIPSDLKVVPERVRTNRHGLFNWDRWNGEQWHTEDLRAYKITRFYMDADRAMKQIRLLQDRKKDHLPPVVRAFWETHYRSVRLVQDGLRSLNMFMVGSSIICFLLRTAPQRIAERFVQQTQSLETINFELEGDVRDLITIRIITVHRTSNPLYFQAAIIRYQMSAASNTHRANELLADKKFRMQIKARRGSLDRVRNSRHMRRAQQKQPARVFSSVGMFEQSNESFPSRWAIEPLNFALSVLLRRLHASLRELQVHLTRTSRILSREILGPKISGTKYTAFHLNWLCDDYVALCYYRLHRFPGSPTQGEIELGKALWSYLRATMRSNGAEGDGAIAPTETSLTTWVPHIYRATNANGVSSPAVHRTALAKIVQSANVQTSNAQLSSALPDIGESRHHRVPITTRRVVNRRGLFNWDRWDGLLWPIDSLQNYKEHSYVQLMSDAKAELQALERRLSSTMPRAVDRFLMAHYQSEWTLYKRLTPFVRLLCDTIVVAFLLRTSPAGNACHFEVHLAAFDTFTIALAHELESLRIIQSALAHLPHNPLLFEFRARAISEQANARSLKSALLVEEKRCRTQFKLARGSDYTRRSPKLNDEQQIKLGKMKMDVTRAKLAVWNVQYPLTVGAHLFRSFHEVLGPLRQTCRQIENLKGIFMDLLSTKGWNRPQLVLIQSRHVLRQTLALVFDLMALRYFRAHRYPESVSEKEVEMDAAFLKRMTSSVRRLPLVDTHYQHIGKGRVRPRRNKGQKTGSKFTSSKIDHEATSPRSILWRNHSGFTLIPLESPPDSPGDRSPAESQPNRRRRIWRRKVIDDEPADAIGTPDDEHAIADDESVFVANRSETEAESLARWLRLDEEVRELD